MLLLMKFESPTVPLDKICEEYLGVSKGTAKLRAKSGTLEIPAFRMGKSQKLPWQVHIADLAQIIDESRANAVADRVGC